MDVVFGVSVPPQSRLAWRRLALLALLLPALLAPQFLAAAEPAPAAPTNKVDAASLSVDAILAMTPEQVRALSSEDLAVILKTLDADLRSVSDQRDKVRVQIFEARRRIQQVDPEVKRLQGEMRDLQEQMEAVLDANPEVKALGDSSEAMAQKLTQLGSRRMDLLRAMAGASAAKPANAGNEGVQP